jgi:hypothetical protein
MDTATTVASGAAGRSSRGKDQILWGEGVWKALDHAVHHEMMRDRIATKFLPNVHVNKKQTTVPSDVVNVPAAGAADPALSVDEAAVKRVNEFWVLWKETPAQVEEESHIDAAASHPTASTPPPTVPHTEAATSPTPILEHTTTSHHGRAPEHSHRASTAVSLAMRSANVLAQGEDLIIFNGANAVVNSALFGGGIVQTLDPNLATNLDNGLLNIDPNGDIKLPQSQVVVVRPSAAGVGGAPPAYRENTLNAVASAFSILQGLGHYEHYALALNTIPYADLHQALPTTLIEPVEPISHLIKAGIYGSGTLPPFAPGAAGNSGLPVTLQGVKLNALATPISGKVLYTGGLFCLSGNTMDLVRGRMEEHLDVVVTFQQKDVQENSRFRTIERIALRLKDVTAVVLFLFMDK